MQRDQPHHQSQGPRLGADLGRQGRRERPLHGGEPHVRAVRVRQVERGVGRFAEPLGAAGWVFEECVECAADEIGAERGWNEGGKGFGDRKSRGKANLMFSCA